MDRKNRVVYWRKKIVRSPHSFSTWFVIRMTIAGADESEKFISLFRLEIAGPSSVFIPIGQYNVISGMKVPRLCTLTCAASVFYLCINLLRSLAINRRGMQYRRSRVSTGGGKMHSTIRLSLRRAWPDKFCSFYASLWERGQRTWSGMHIWRNQANQEQCKLTIDYSLKLAVGAYVWESEHPRFRHFRFISTTPGFYYIPQTSWRPSAHSW